MKSHEYAKELQDLATYLLSKPEFETGTAVYFFSNHHKKESFIAAVKALGAGKKEFKNDQIIFTPKDMPVIGDVQAPRNLVCTLVTPAVYDCEPLLSPEEEASVGA